MNFSKLEKNTDVITKNILKLNNNISLLKKKIILLDTINSKLEHNTFLKQENNNNLSFQSSILKNEFSYYTNIYNIILEKYSKDLYELTEYILIILISLNKLEINKTEQKKIIYNKIIYTKQIKNVNSGKLKEIIHNIINNLKVVDEYIELFNNYITELSKENTNKNIHNNNYVLNIEYKKQTIVLEYKKYCDKFKKMIYYFEESLDSIINQIDNSKLLNFFLKLKASI